MTFTRCCTWPPASTPNRRNLPGAWDVNDRLRADATRLLVDGALSANTELIVVPTAAFVYPPGPADESTPLADLPELLRLSCPGGIYNVCDDTDPVSHDRFTEATGWRPRQTQ
jgi:hypothetical protein